jgi:hypothetical protein
MIEPLWLVTGGIFFVGMLGALLLIDAVRCVRRRWQCPRLPVTKGQVHLFDDDGEGHFLSAKLPLTGLVKLLSDLERGRFN